MDPDEIGLVVARVSQLRQKFTDSIRGLSNNISGPGGGARSRNFRSEHDSGIAASPMGDEDESAEIRSLTAIHEALELVEDKLTSLQSLQQQQRQENDAVRVELEKSRRTLMKRLKEHRGNEWQVVHETLSFVGEKAEDDEDLPLPPYPQPLDNYDQSSSSGDNLAGRQYDGTVKKLSLGMALEGEGNETRIMSGNHRSSRAIENERSPAGFLKTLFNHVYGVTTKAAVVLLSLAAAVAVFESKQKQQSTSPKATFFADENSPRLAISGPPLLTVRQVAPNEWCPQGTMFILENGYAKCIAHDPRNGSSHSQQLSVPDVLNGRG